jgi:hypothetical protein
MKEWVIGDLPVKIIIKEMPGMPVGFRQARTQYVLVGTLEISGFLLFLSYAEMFSAALKTGRLICAQEMYGCRWSFYC